MTHKLKGAVERPWLDESRLVAFENTEANEEDTAELIAEVRRLWSALGEAQAKINRLETAWDAVADEFPGPHDGEAWEGPAELMLKAVRNLKAKVAGFYSEESGRLREQAEEIERLKTGLRQRTGVRCSRCALAEVGLPTPGYPHDEKCAEAALAAERLEMAIAARRLGEYIEAVRVAESERDTERAKVERQRIVLKRASDLLDCWSYSTMRSSRGCTPEAPCPCCLVSADIEALNPAPEPTPSEEATLPCGVLPSDRLPATEESLRFGPGVVKDYVSILHELGARKETIDRVVVACAGSEQPDHEFVESKHSWYRIAGRCGQCGSASAHRRPCTEEPEDRMRVDSFDFRREP